MMILIVVNTISLSSEGYHTNEEDQDVLNSINLGCTVVFGIEIIVLIVAYVLFSIDPYYSTHLTHQRTLDQFTGTDREDTPRIRSIFSMQLLYVVCNFNHITFSCDLS